MDENQLHRFLLLVGRLAGLVGVLICAVAVVVRLSGAQTMMGFEAASVLQAGIALMVLGCLGYLALLARPK